MITFDLANICLGYGLSVEESTISLKPNMPPASPSRVIKVVEAYIREHRGKPLPYECLQCIHAIWCNPSFHDEQVGIWLTRTYTDRRWAFKHHLLAGVQEYTSEQLRTLANEKEALSKPHCTLSAEGLVNSLSQGGVKEVVISATQLDALIQETAKRSLWLSHDMAMLMRWQLEGWITALGEITPDTNLKSHRGKWLIATLAETKLLLLERSESMRLIPSFLLGPLIDHFPETERLEFLLAWLKSVTEETRNKQDFTLLIDWKQIASERLMELIDSKDITLFGDYAKVLFGKLIPL